MPDPEMTAKNSVTFPNETYQTGSTVDAEAASGQKVVPVTATTNFAEGDRVILDRGNAGEEEGVIDSISSGVSITLLVNLANTHAIGVVVEVIMKSVSTVMVKKHYKRIVLFLPADWTTAKITFLGCLTEDGTFTPVVKGTDVAELEIAEVAASKTIGLDGILMQTLANIPYLKLRSGVEATPVDQGTDKTINYILMR